MSTAVAAKRDDAASCGVRCAGAGIGARVVFLAAVTVAVLLALVGPTPSIAAPPGHVPDQVLVRFRPGTSALGRAAVHAAAGATVVTEFATVPGLQLIRLAPGTALARALEQYRRRPDVLYVEPNQALKLQAVPDDPGFVAGELWGLNMIPYLFEDADIDAPEAWDLSTGSRNVVVAVIDSGIDYTHEDLAANMFRNEADCNANGFDDDGNGFVDDCYGMDFIDGDSDPMDADVHGTHVAGTIGAVGNNGVGVVGVNWAVRLMPCKVFDAAGSGSLAAAISCLDYVAMMKDRGVDVVAANASWSVAEFSASLRDAIEAHRQRGILLVAAAGNYGLSQCLLDADDCRTDTDNDRKPTWPASFYLPNVIGVANSVDWGYLNSGSARGRRTVHLAAPGTWILSTTPGNTYDYYAGTSMAAPHVTGVAALLKAQNPGRDWKAIKNLILAGTDGNMYQDNGQLITGKRLNARNALACAGRTVASRLRPIRSTVHAVVGHPMELAALHVQCAVPNGDVTVTVSPGGQVITLRDDGTGLDQEAGDGIYSAQWTPAVEGTFSLAFPGADVVSVQVLASTYSVAVVPFENRAITGTRLTFIPAEPAVIASPFPLHFAGGSFTTLVVDDRGAVHFDGGGYNADLAVFNEPLPSPHHSTLIAPFWDQILPLTPGVGDVVWEVRGTAPNRELVVEWRNMERSDRFCALFEGFVTFQVVFFESSSDLLFNYSDTTFGGECPDLDGGASATVGIQVAPDVATLFSFNTPALADGMSLRWTLGAAPQPAIGVTPASRDFGTIAVGASADATFVVENTGTGTLTGQATAIAPFSIVAGGAYALGAGQTQVVTARFSPTGAGTFLSNVTFTGGGGASAAVRGVGAAATGVDLTVTAVSDPPPVVVLGEKFAVTDTVTNLGGQGAGETRTRYYLSADAVRGSGDKRLGGARSVPALAPGAASTGSKTVTVPASTKVGVYVLLACADDYGVVAESDETNNCRAGAVPVEVRAPNLKETAVADPPATVGRGGVFVVTDTVANQGNAGAGVSTTRFYLSADTKGSKTDTLLGGSRGVPALGVGAVSSGTVAVTVPGTAPTGEFYLLACADDVKKVAESNEKDNCRAAPSRVMITP